MRITNFKYGTRLKFPQNLTARDLSELAKQFNLKFINNFIVYKNKYTFIIFSGGYVNITGVKDQRGLSQTSRTCLSVIFGEKVDLEILVLQNISATCQLERRINLLSCKIKIKDCKYYPSSSKYLKKLGLEKDISTFPAVKLFTDVGTALIFASGKCNIVGVKEKKHLEWIWNVCRNAVGISESFNREMNTAKSAENAITMI